MSQRPERKRDGLEPEEPEEVGEAATGRLPDPLADEVAQLNAKYQRLAADFENYKRRKAQEVEDASHYGAAAMLQALLPALDSLERALAHIPEDADDGLSEGLRLTLRQLQEALASQGVRRIATVGEPFNPHLHDAVVSLPGPGAGSNTVLAELLPGYTMHDRVLRPAQVGVTQPAEEVQADAAGGPEAREPEAPPSRPRRSRGDSAPEEPSA